MTEAEAKVVPYLFMILFGLIVVNLFINVCLFMVSKITNIKVLAWYWLALLGTYFVQGQFQTGEMGIMLSFSVNIVPCFMISKMLYDSLRKEFPFKRYLGIFLTGVTISAVLKFIGLDFAIAALPMTMAVCLTVFEPGFKSLVTYRNTSTMTQKFTGIIFIIGGLHSINFALFRMYPGAQIWGWSVALGFYQLLSLSLFTLAFEEYSKEEKQRLQVLVNERTEELSRTLQVKDTLFKVVLHDIANPIQGQSWIMNVYNEGRIAAPEAMNKLSRLNSMIKEVIKQVRSIEVVNSGEMTMPLKPVSLQQCLDDLNIIFEGPLSTKELKLTIKNELPPGTLFLADQNAFTTSVMCNLISNAIKFSPVKKDLIIRSYLKNKKVVIEVEDQGIGMPMEMASGMFNPLLKKSRRGTFGEEGTGYGMPLAKSFIDYFGGDIAVESREIDTHPLDHGTKITLTLDQTSSH